VFFSQSPSFLAHQTLMEKEKGISNARSVFAIRGIPTDNQIRGVLDLIDPALLRSTFGLTVDMLKEKGVLDSFRFLEGNFFLPWMALATFSRNPSICPSCTVHHHRDGRTTYSHKRVAAGVGTTPAFPGDPAGT